MKDLVMKYGGVVLFYIVIVLMIMIVNARFNHLNNTIDNVTYAYNN